MKVKGGFMFVIQRISNERAGGGDLTYQAGEVAVVQLGEVLTEEGEFDSNEKAALRISELEKTSKDKFTVVKR